MRMLQCAMMLVHPECISLVVAFCPKLWCSAPTYGRGPHSLDRQLVPDDSASRAGLRVIDQQAHAVFLL